MQPPWKVIGAVLALGALLPVFTPTADAREVRDPNDPALAGAFTLPLPPPGVPDGATSFEVTVAGVTFRFENTLDQPLVNPFGPGIRVTSNFTAGTGVLVTMSPPVDVIAFTAQSVDGQPGGIFFGTTGIEEYAFEFGEPDPVFYGAADIGTIPSVSLEYPGGFSLFLVREMTFVPAVNVPADEADLASGNTASSSVAVENAPVQFTLEAQNLGPDAAADTRLTAFFTEGTYSSGQPVPTLPDDGTAIWQLGELGAGLISPVSLGLVTPDRTRFSCNQRLSTFSLATSTTPDPDLSNNLAVSVVEYDVANGSVPEICGNGIDDDCDGFFDCADTDCDCRPVLPPGPNADRDCISGVFEGVPEEVIVEVITCGNGAGGGPGGNNANDHGCTVPRGRCGGVTVPAFCCDPSTWSDPSNNANDSLAACDVGIPGCAPVDPNFKTAVPTTNIAGYGFADAGETITYTIQYENIGNADALNVEIIDVLDRDLDESTLVIEDGGTYDAATRTLRWIDPVLPPATPRTVSFRIDMREDAPVGTRARNVATIVFPNAVPPSRIDTNFVEHVVPGPRARLPLLSVLSCDQVGPNEWQVNLLNERQGFAYNAAATLVDPPASVTVLGDDTARFSHIDDLFRDQLGTVVPNAFTPSTDTVQFATLTPVDPCPALQWRIRWEDLQGVETVAVVQREPDEDRDAVADEIDNCLDLYNPLQEDTNGDGIGDACDVPELPAIDDLTARAKAVKVSLLWAPVSDAVSYQVWRRTGEDGAFEQIAADHMSDFATFLDSGLVTGETYAYFVRWVDGQGNVSPDSNTVTVTLQRRGRR